MFVKSILNKLNLVSEILLCKVNFKNDYQTEYSLGDKKVYKFGYKNNYFYQVPSNIHPETKKGVSDIKTLYLGHPLGLKYCIDRAKNNLVMLCDPDIFFYSAVDQLYYDLMKKYDLSYVGACPHLSYLYSTKYFPNVLCMLMDKRKLPTEDFLRGKIISQDTICGNVGEAKILRHHYPREPEYLDGEYLIGGKISSLAKEFPNPDGLFDTGVYLSLWAKQNNQNWLGFQPKDIHLYTSQIYRTNLKIKERLPIQKLFYHATGGARHLYLDQFTEEYNRFHREEE